MIEAELHDGRILEFPDGTDPAVVQKAVRNVLSQGTPEPVAASFEPVGQESDPALINELEPGMESEPELGDLGEGPGVSLAELSGGFLTRGTFETAGAIAGGVVGGGGAIPTGPGAVAGALGGATLGAAGGSTAFDAAEGALRLLGLVTTPEPSLPDKAQKALEAAAFEMSFGTAATVARPILKGRRLLEKVFGLRTAESLHLQDLARHNGIDVGAMDVGGQFPRVVNATMNVFPITGDPARKAISGKFKQTASEINRRLNTLAPTATTMSELGVDMVKAAKGARAEFKLVADDLYTSFEDLAENASKLDIIPTKNAKELSKEFSTQSDLSRILLDDQSVLDKPTANEASEFLEQLKGMPENVTIHQYRGLMDSLSDLFGKFEGQGASTAKLMDMKKALEGDLASIRADLLPDGEGKALVEALETANNFFAKGSVNFQSSVANKFRRVDRNIFRAGAERPGTIDSDELAHVVLNMRSPQSVEALARLVGDDNMAQAARNVLDDAVNQSTQMVRIGKEEVPVFDPEKLTRMLKLEGLKSMGLRALLKRSGVDPSDLSDFLKVAGSIEDVGDASAFAARRTAIAGTGSIKGLLGLGLATTGGGAAAGGVAGAGIGLIGAAAMTVLGRWASRIVADPRKLKLMTAALDTQRKQATRQLALAGIINGLVQDLRGGRSFVAESPAEDPLADVSTAQN